MTKTVQEAAPKILEAIRAAKSILLHCHPSPDPDSVGSALAMKFALEGMGKKATVIRGDSEIPQAFMHFPGAHDIVPKNFFEVDLGDFDLFIIQDTGGLNRISGMGKVSTPEGLRTVVIDHHDSTQPFGTIANLIDPSCSSTAEMLFDLFKIWNIEITPNIAANLFIGIYTDTGAFKFPKTTYAALVAASELARIYPKFTELISTMENSRKPYQLVVLGLALSNIRTFLNDNLTIAGISNQMLKDKGIDDPGSGGARWSVNMLHSVAGWNICVAAIEAAPGKVKISFATRDEKKFDVSKLAQALGGGGHKAAAGAILNMPLEQAIEKIVATARELYNL